MSGIAWLPSGGAADAFPPAAAALEEPNGLLAAGGDLRPERLLAAYRQGIFPWYEQGQPILWWSPDPRAVLFPRDLRISRSLRRTLKRGAFTVTVDTAFDEVLAGCAAPRPNAAGTWITREMADAYGTLHRLGWAHSFETRSGGHLVGGLYGVAIGRVFFGESMFARTADASKAALVQLVCLLEQRGFELIDCQVASSHMASLGAVELPRTEFLRRLEELCEPPGTPGSWRLE